MMVDRKSGAAIYTAPQMRGPSKTVFDNVTAEQKILQKLLTMPKT
jgi:hypothetical protein